MTIRMSSSSHLHLIFLVFIGISRNVDSQLDPIGLLCGLINCGEGTCKASNSTSDILPVACDCNPGYIEAQLGPIKVPLCVPNCTYNAGCGQYSPPSSPIPVLPPLLPPTDPCAWAFCGEGTCVPQGTTHICQCNQGSANLNNQPSLTCFKLCGFDGSCTNLAFGNPPSPPPSASSRNSPSGVSNTSTTLLSLSILLLTAIFISMF